MPKTKQVLERYRWRELDHDKPCYGRVVNLYINRRIDGKLKWIKVGEYCLRCCEVGLLEEYQKKEEKK